MKEKVIIFNTLINLIFQLLFCILILAFKFKFFSDNIIKEKSRNDFNNKEHARK